MSRWKVVGYGGALSECRRTSAIQRREEYLGDRKKERNRVSTLLLLCVLLFRVAFAADTHVRNITSNPDRVWVMEEGKEDGTLLLLLPLSITRRRRRKRGNSVRERERGTRLTDGIYLLFFSGTRPDSRPKLFTSSTFSSSFLKLFFFFLVFILGQIFFFPFFFYLFILLCFIV